MPIFDVLCPDHGTQEAFAHDSANTSCPLCMKPAKRVWNAPATFRIDFTPGWDMGLGKHVNSKQERDNILAEKNLRRVRD